MKSWLRTTLLSLFVALPAGPMAAREGPQGTTAQPRDQLVITGEVVRIHAPRIFTIREEASGREWLVLAPRPLLPAMEGGTVRVGGTLRRVDAAELGRVIGSSDLEQAVRARLTAAPVLVASSIIGALRGETKSPLGEELPAPPPSRGALPPTEQPPLTIRPTTLVADIEGLAGSPVRILSARVVGVFEPGAFLVEPATRYLKPMGERDRVLVLVEGGGLRVRPELVVGSTVKIVGAARTLVGMQVGAEVPWPTRLEPEIVERLEIRAAILARSVQTPEGIELTDRQPAQPR